MPRLPVFRDVPMKVDWIHASHAGAVKRSTIYEYAEVAPVPVCPEKKASSAPAMRLTRSGRCWRRVTSSTSLICVDAKATIHIGDRATIADAARQFVITLQQN
jgi:hypothetical protein